MDTLDVTAGRVLIIDDNPSNVALLERMLDSAGYKSVLGVTDPRDALDLYLSFRPQLILLDILMPHLNGFQLMRQFREAACDDYLPILVLTALTDKATRVRALDLGAKDFLSKPLDQTEALARIRNILEVSILHQRALETNKTLDGLVRERTRELQETRLEIIRRLGMAAEFKDNETGDHIIRMSKVSQLLALSMGLSEEESELILQASPMHDVGKIGIPDHILLKPGKLDEEEWEIMKRHAEIGFKLLNGHASQIMLMAREIAYTHHEWWDGTGYPRGLRGEEIPMTGRICALADTFDALTSRRPYKKAWKVEDAVAEILRQRGTHFQPELVDCFLDNLAEILKITFEDGNHGTKE